MSDMTNELIKSLRATIEQQAQDLQSVKEERARWYGVAQRQAQEIERLKKEVNDEVQTSLKYLGERNEKIKQLATMTRERDEANERADRLFRDRYALLSVKTTDGLSASEWIMRTATAEGKLKELQARVKELESISPSDEIRDLMNTALREENECGAWAQKEIIDKYAQLQATLAAREEQLRLANIDQANTEAALNDARQDAARLERELRQRMWTLHYSRMQHAPYGDDGCLDCNTCGRDYAKASMDELQQWELLDASHYIRAVEQAQRAMNTTASPSSPQSP